MSTYFTVASIERQCYGHGDFGDALIINGPGGYGGDFPPLFKTKKEAEEYIKSSHFSNPTVVELHVKE